MLFLIAFTRNFGAELLQMCTISQIEQKIMFMRIEFVKVRIYVHAFSLTFVSSLSSLLLGALLVIMLYKLKMFIS